MSDRSQIEEIKERLDIVSVVQEYVPSLKKSGRNYFGLCPFHQEKSPSFSVNSELGMFKCFGCGEGGDAIKFLEKIEGLDFSHALENAAKRVGITLVKNTNPKLAKERAKKQKILEANTLTAQYFNYLLTKHKNGEIAREYAKKRKLTAHSIETYKLGFAPVGFENLKNFLLKRGFELRDLVDWGLLVEKNNRIYDKFRNRLMFPIMDHQGEIVGFSGRAIDKDEKGPKYLNSPETPVYNKSKLLYGLYQAKETVRKEDFAIIVEGNIDIISSYQAGVKNIVAPLGTALTEDQLKLLKRYCTKIYLSFDTDSAGQRALLRSLELAEKVGLQTLAIDIGEYQDVDEMITSGGDWQKIVSKAKPVIDFLIKTLSKNYNLEDSRQKSEFVKQILTYVTKIENDIEISDYIEKLSKKSNVDRDTLLEQLKKLPAGQNFNIQENKPTLIKRVFKLDEETYLLALLVQHVQWKDLAKALDPVKLFQNGDNTTLFNLILNDKTIPSEFEDLIVNVKMSDIEVFGHKEEFEKELETSVNRLRKLFIKKQLNALRNSDDDSALDKLQELSQELGGL
ncbi:MAG TPA: DNA primase [Candidatus Dojkabacteria bacterium]|nr:DNA primase [Candidatus Dojkabacteria bacterium]HRP51052.1 DNA primase [Candidatus Dojkabacteria bacterium]